MASRAKMALHHATSDYDYIYNPSFELYDYNDTTESPRQYPDFPSMSNVCIPVLYFIMFFVGFSGNLFVIVVMGNRRWTNGRLVDTFVLNLALADLVFVFTLPLWAVSDSHGHWLFGEPMCKISSFVVAVNRFSNICFLTCMSVDRYLVVVRLMDSRYLRRGNCMRLVCAIVWITSLLLGIPTLVYRELTEGDLCSEDLNSSLVQGMNLLTVLLTFLLPVLILSLCYGSIVVTLRRQCRLAGNLRVEARRRHSLKIVFTIISAFVISWLPFNVFKTIQVIMVIKNEEREENTMTIILSGLTLSCCLAFLNSCVNPAIYLFLDQSFRHRAFVLCTTSLNQGDPKQSEVFSNSFSDGNSCSENTSTRGHLFSVDQNV